MRTNDPVWFKSSYSGSSGDNCVEVALCSDAVLVRDSKDIPRLPLAISRHAWSDFVTCASELLS
ncbi:DUF397 domain-containing protein [Streptomyces sp. NPDC059166]|uniref:DUF397 domain-containing protein n=1 Tax=Streptomyces sp. NPDC059166 TaxID=3346752 RepID=UPI0036A7264C